VAVEELAVMRAGFAQGGVVVNFGFDVTTSLNGIPMQRVTLPTGPVGGEMPVSVTRFATPAELSAGAPLRETEMRGLSAGGMPFSVVLPANEGATRIATTIGEGGITSLLQNTANGQMLQRTGRFDIEIVGLRAQLTHAAMQAYVASALTARQALPR
jgi:hypothetical protein